MVTLNGVKPSNSKEGKIWNKYNNNLSGYEWDWYLIRHWPRNLAQAVISEDLGYMERWQLWLYFVGNGMSPTQGTDMVLISAVNTLIRQRLHTYNLLTMNI